MSLFFLYGIIILIMLHSTFFLSQGLIQSLLTTLPLPILVHVQDFVDMIGVDLQTLNTVTEIIIIADILFVAVLFIKISCFGICQLNAGMITIVALYLLASVYQRYGFGPLEITNQQNESLDLHPMHFELWFCDLIIF